MNEARAVPADLSADARSGKVDLLQAAARTDPGRARSNNEDLPLIDPARGVFGVIDGVGGQAGGEVAAAIARDVILQRLARPLGTPTEKVREAIAIANNEIYRRAQDSVELRGMACVITLAIVADGRLVAGHVGDTRLYKIRGDGIRKLTRDHSPVGEREDAGELGEIDAMRHPRRNEVFRDVGSILRDKDEREFVDVLEESVEPDSALLVCSDGLTDMIPSSTIVHLVRQHAGDPGRVVDALVAAANDAGGKDNVTVVYAEGALFAASIGAMPQTMTPTEPLPDASRRVGNGTAAATVAGPLAGGAGRSILRSLTLWFIVGTLVGTGAAIGLMFYLAKSQAAAPQTLVVAGDGSAPYRRIGQAVAAANPGDLVRVEPGEYEERFTLADRVDVVARLPGTVTVRRPRGLQPSVPLVAAASGANVRLSGIRFLMVPELATSTGFRIGPSATVSLEMVEITGPFDPAIALSPGAALTMQGGRVAVAGTILGLPNDAQANLGNNIFTRQTRSAEPAIAAGASSRLTLSGNVFAGFDPEIVRGFPPARRSEILSTNIVLPPAAPPRTRPGPAQSPSQRSR